MRVLIIINRGETMKILIAIDDSPCSTLALDSVAQRHWPKGAQFQIIMIVEPIVYDYSYALSAKLASALTEANTEFRDYCDQLVKTKVNQFKKSTGHVDVAGKIIDGLVTDSILQEATNWDADLIVLGSHGRKGIQKVVLGSVAEKVASHSPCSIEIVKQKERQHG